ncbi:MAG TPA: CHAP domain-containing protein, partial [Blastocatellia bacterium]|nr:CHAP domain-containing protein [Blastocatellia bacterium]
MSRTILEEALVVAQSQLGVREKPLGSNRGPEVDVYIESVGLAPTGKYAWCAAFVYWCYKRAAEQLQVKNPAAKTGGSLMQWTLASMRHCYRL